MKSCILGLVLFDSSGRKGQKGVDEPLDEPVGFSSCDGRIRPRSPASSDPRVDASLRGHLVESTRNGEAAGGGGG